MTADVTATPLSRPRFPDALNVSRNTHLQRSAETAARAGRACVAGEEEPGVHSLSPRDRAALNRDDLSCSSRPGSICSVFVSRVASIYTKHQSCRTCCIRLPFCASSSRGGGCGEPQEICAGKPPTACSADLAPSAASSQNRSDAPRARQRFPRIACTRPPPRA